MSNKPTFSGIVRPIVIIGNFVLIVWTLADGLGGHFVASPEQIISYFVILIILILNIYLLLGDERILPNGYIAYLRDNPEGFWFKRKLYGFGWTPARWQGWVVLFIYICAVLFVVRKIDQASHSASDTFYGIFLPFVILTAILVFVCYKTGEKPRWQWGLPKKEEDEKDKKFFD